MMWMADDCFNFWSGGDSASWVDIEAGGGEFTISDDEFNLSIDLDSFYSILGEDSDPQELSRVVSSFQNVIQSDSASIVGNHENFPLTTGLQGLEGAPSVGTNLPGTHNSSLSCDLQASDFEMWGPEILFESDGNFDYGKLDFSAQIGSPLEMLHSDTRNEIPDCSNVFGFAAGDVNHVPDCPDNADLTYVRGDVDSKYTSYSPVLENLEINKGNYGIPSENSIETLGAPEDNSYTSMVTSSNNATHTKAISQVSDNICSDFHPAMQYSMSEDGTPFAVAELSDSLARQFIPRNETTIKDENEFSTENVYFNPKMISNDQFGRSARHVPHMSAIDHYNLKGFKYEAGNYISPFNENCFSKGSVELSTQTQSHTSSQKQEPRVTEEGMNEAVTPQSSTEVMGKAIISNSFPGADDSFFTNKDFEQSFPGPIKKDFEQSFPGNRPQLSSMKHVVHAKDEKEDILFPSKRAFHSEVIIGETVNRHPVDGGCMILQKSTSMKKQLDHIKNEKESKLVQSQSMGSHLSKFSTESVQSSPSGKSIHVGDDTDICILEDISMPPRSNPSLVQAKSFVTSQRSPLYDPLYHIGDGGQRFKANDERNIFRVALQDLSQAKLEASPPEGLLAVPLLRHQKIALSWMVQKETANLFCSGGILADDQGLGKTISTIALILKERSPSSKAFQMCTEQGDLETLNLEDDDNLELDGTKIRDASVQSRGRPAAGTLVVCPTSVLRQWAEELHNKVTGKANLSVLVYHGNNRTKDPCELAKYDVVITTYSIVSMEVPKQPLVDKDDDEEKKAEPRVVQSMSFASSRKRKYPPSSYKRGLKDKKGMGNALLESAARPLAKVGWFRVVLDEAQSIKNHRTQVARACWGLRAKRRWCLSGTPIQNAIDDLYSYFRFLRYDPYAVYTSFCSTIKVPINRNPASGYRKLQAVLKTIMLRRTKGTLLDGEPIINLPPKSVELKRVDFSEEERDFYSRLEADSRAQFEEYAAAGTVKQNYVNILLMLLRLRQACDHPLLVKGCNSKSIWRSSVEMAKKLPQDKRICLLACLEASLAICGICNDPPEDAVVSICGHVFCNQCICDYLTGDDNQCPSTNCKVQLSVSSVFSKATLKCSLDSHSAQGDSPSSSGCELDEALEPCSEGLSFNSSKIKAALEVLQSLSKPQEGTASSISFRSFGKTTICPEASSDPQSRGVHTDIPDKGNIVVDMDKDLNASIKVVGEKAIVFSQWTRMLDLLEACLKNSSIQYRRLDGTMSVLARDRAVKDFNTRPEVSVMIMSLKAASLGLNMVAACHVVLLDLWWNPTTEDQAIDRAHRIGQTRPVTVLRLTVKDTVEDRILALQQKKREMVASAFGEDETGSRQTRLTVEDLEYLFMV